MRGFQFLKVFQISYTRHTFLPERAKTASEIVLHSTLKFWVLVANGDLNAFPTKKKTEALFESMMKSQPKDLSRK